MELNSINNNDLIETAAVQESNCDIDSIWIYGSHAQSMVSDFSKTMSSTIAKGTTTASERALENASESLNSMTSSKGIFGMDELTVNAKQRNVNISLDGESCNVHGSKDMLKELVENLAQNAIRYNNAGGKVWVSVTKRDGRSVLTVKDNGIGIPASEQQRIFERFYRVDKSRSKATGGTGLGLAIVKHIVEIHDAKIELDSSPGVGTAISVMF